MHKEEQLVVFRRVRDEIKMVFEAYADGRSDEAYADGHSDEAKSMAAHCANPQVIMEKATCEP